MFEKLKYSRQYNQLNGDKVKPSELNALLIVLIVFRISSYQHINSVLFSLLLSPFYPFFFEKKTVSNHETYAWLLIFNSDYRPYAVVNL